MKYATREPKFPVENASQRRISRQLEALHASSWIPLAPEIQENAEAHRALMLWLFGKNREAGFVGEVIQFILIAVAVTASMGIFIHNLPTLWHALTCGAAC